MQFAIFIGLVLLFAGSSFYWYARGRMDERQEWYQRWEWFKRRQD